MDGLWARDAVVVGRRLAIELDLLADHRFIADVPLARHTATVNDGDVEPTKRC
jgi:hypothetical protein